MSRPAKKEYAVVVALRVPDDWAEEADRIAGELSLPGRVATRSDGFRVAIARGFESIAQERAENFARGEKGKKGR